MLITLEGVDGAGKDTVASALQKRLQKQDLDVVVLNEPDHLGLSGLIRGMLTTPGHDYNDLTQMMLLQAARADNIIRNIIPNIRAGRVVICTRSPLSTAVYQIPKIANFLDRTKSLFIDPSEHYQTLMNTIGLSEQLLRDASIIEHRILLTIDVETSLERTKRRGELDYYEGAHESEITQRIMHYKNMSKLMGYTNVSNEGEITATVDTIMGMLGC